MKTLVACLLLCTFSSSVWAQAIPAFPPGEDKIVPLKKGDPAPYAGQLFDPATAIRWGNWLQQYQLRLKTDVETQKKVDEAQITYLNKILELERKQYTTVTTDYKGRLQRAEAELQSPAWYRTPAFGVAVGILGTLGAVALGVAVVRAGSK